MWGLAAVLQAGGPNYSAFRNEVENAFLLAKNLYRGCGARCHGGGSAGPGFKITKKTTVGEASFSSETLLKGARERTAVQIAGAPATVTIRQCDLKRSVTLSDQSKAYLVAKDPEDDSVNRAAALVSGDAGAPSVGGKVTVTSTVTDTGERKTLFGYPARHLKTTVVAASSPSACSPVSQKYQIDGWYIDLKDRAACKGFVPPVHSDVANCTDKVVTRQVGTANRGSPSMKP